MTLDAHRKIPRSTARANGDATRQRLLDAAEALFGEQTFATVSLRDITRKAGVAVALASYHFGSKEAMFRECVARRAAILNAWRREQLARLSPEASGTEVLEAFMRPLFEQIRGGESGWPAYLRIVAKLGHDAQWLALLHEHFDETAQAYVERLAAALPETPRPALLRGFALTLDAMLQTLSRNRRIDTLSDGAVTADDLDAAYDAMIRFCVAGFMGLSSSEAQAV
jgi:AcrR family transcriptional regulator